jgi:hypothetical protein
MRMAITQVSAFVTYPILVVYLLLLKALPCLSVILFSRLDARKFAFSSGACVLNFNNGTGEERVGTEACCTLPARAHSCAVQPCHSGLVRSM